MSLRNANPEKERAALEEWGQAAGKGWSDFSFAYPIRRTPMFTGACGACNGLGRVRYQEVRSGMHMGIERECPVCNGEGTIDPFPKGVSS